MHYRPNVAASDSTIMLINEVLDAENPDLVVFTGDIAWGTPTKECFDNVLEPLLKRNILWAYVNGNNDDERGWSRTQLMDYLVTKPYCMDRHGEKHLQGEGNYILELRSSEDKNKISNLLYFLDSGSIINYIQGWDGNTNGFLMNK